MREERGTPGRLLSAGQVRQMLEVDRSTIYRMAENGRLTEVVIPCPWYTEHEAGPGLLDACRQDRKGLAQEPPARYRLSTQERAGC